MGCGGRRWLGRRGGEWRVWAGRRAFGRIISKDIYISPLKMELVFLWGWGGKLWAGGGGMGGGGGGGVGGGGRGGGGGGVGGGRGYFTCWCLKTAAIEL